MIGFNFAQHHRRGRHRGAISAAEGRGRLCHGDDRARHAGLRHVRQTGALGRRSGDSGAWLGGFAFSPLLALLFLGIGLGAIWQVIVEVVALLRNYAAQEESPLFSWINVGGFLAGLAIMYFTAFLVKF